MPFYPALPEYRPSTVTPMSALTAGLGAGTELTGAIQNQAIKREALQQQRAKMEGQKQFAQTGDPAALMASAPDMYFKANAAQREAIDYAMADAQRNLAMVPPEQYPAMRQNMIQRHGAKNPGLGQALDLMLPKPGATATDLKAFSTRLGDLQGEMQAKAAGAKAKAVGTEDTVQLQKRYETITKKEQEQAQKDRMELLGQQYKDHLGLQVNRQNFEYMQQDKKLKFEESFKQAQIEGRTQDHLISSVESYNHAIDAKALEMKKKAAEAYTGPELAEQERKIDGMVEVAKRDNLKMMKPFFDKAKVPFVYNIADYSRTGPPPGTDPDFDNAMARANAIPDAAKRAETVRAVISRWNQMDTRDTAAPTTGASAAAPTPAPATAPPAAPAAPAAAPPAPAAAPAAPTPAPAPAPKPEPKLTRPAAAPAGLFKKTPEKDALIDKLGVTMTDKQKEHFYHFYDALRRFSGESDTAYGERILEFVMSERI